MERLRLGLALTGSFCTFKTALESARELSACYDVTPIMSESAVSTDTRFGRAADFEMQLEEICGKSVISTIRDAEPIGPQALLDLLVIAPCTGNTLAKLANGITDSSVTMAAKAHLRNSRPLVIAVSTNDGLSGSAANIGLLMAKKNVYFVPYRQDDPVGKPTSLVADFDRIIPAVEAAIGGRQLQPLLLA